MTWRGEGFYSGVSCELHLLSPSGGGSQFLFVRALPFIWALAGRTPPHYPHNKNPEIGNFSNFDPKLGFKSIILVQIAFNF
jgi:hypothetical protein